MKLRIATLTALATSLAGPLAFAAEAGEPTPTTIWMLVADALLFGVAGLVLLIAAFFVWDLLTPFKLREELVEQHNVAVGIVTAAIIVGTAVVVGAALLVVG